MWGLIVVLGLVAVVVLVGVLVALGMRASRSGGDDDWMAEDEQQPRGRRGGRSRGRRGEEELPEEEPYGDMRVAGSPIAQHGGHHQQLPSAPHAGPAPLPAPAPSTPVPAQSGRSSDEMDDDEYWSTITFDKPRFPWRQNAEQPGRRARARPARARRSPSRPAAHARRARPDRPAPAGPHRAQPRGPAEHARPADGAAAGRASQPARPPGRASARDRPGRAARVRLRGAERQLRPVRRGAAAGRLRRPAAGWLRR